MIICRVGNISGCHAVYRSGSATAKASDNGTTHVGSVTRHAKARNLFDNVAKGGSNVFIDVVVQNYVRLGNNSSADFFGPKR